MPIYTWNEVLFMVNYNANYDKMVRKKEPYFSFSPCYQSISDKKPDIFAKLKGTDLVPLERGHEYIVNTSMDSEVCRVTFHQCG